MRSAHILSPLAASVLLWLAAAVAPAQQVTVGTPFHAVNDSFFERIGTNWGFNYKGFHATFGGPNMAVPPFGNFDPSAGINGGWSRQGGAFNGFFNFAAGQGFRQSFVSQTPSITLTNGYPGYFSDTSQSPFVVGVVPIVGGFVPGFPIGTQPYYTTGFPGYPMSPPMQPIPQGNPRVRAMLGQLAGGNPPEPLLAGLPGGGPAPPRPPQPQAPARPAAIDTDPSMQKLAAAQSSSAGRAVPGVAEARRLRQLEQAAGNDEAAVLYEHGLTAEDGGKPGVAKIYYNRALKLANGQLRSQILARLKAVSSADTPK